MPDQFDTDDFTANDMRIALNEIFPESTYGAIPVIDQYDALEAYFAFDDGALVNFRFIANTVWTTEEAVEKINDVK